MGNLRKTAIMGLKAIRKACDDAGERCDNCAVSDICDIIQCGMGAIFDADWPDEKDKPNE